MVIHEKDDLGCRDMSFSKPLLSYQVSISNAQNKLYENFNPIISIIYEAIDGHDEWKMKQVKLKKI